MTLSRVIALRSTGQSGSLSDHNRGRLSHLLRVNEAVFVEEVGDIRAIDEQIGSHRQVVARQPFGGFAMSGVGSKAGGMDYLLQFVEPRASCENTLRRGFAPEL